MITYLYFAKSINVHQQIKIFINAVKAKDSFWPINVYTLKKNKGNVFMWRKYMCTISEPELNLLFWHVYYWKKIIRLLSFNSEIQCFSKKFQIAFALRVHANWKLFEKPTCANCVQIELEVVW